MITAPRLTSPKNSVSLGGPPSIAFGQDRIPSRMWIYGI
ncbi:hypothetical protein ACVWZJ_001986 [Thermostichus sp. OS-CIW-29]